ncbi:hypothetical protein M9H77_16657 [Catharanthus roseus]|uniref:Uncharacterized protein n=1 Tax=Catharanthus roseus TaxID=4058 RepID=A0ACC0B2D7_CATRO|nr:hypothetical protein M9H77_16657 [Catharanthus roseus]
MYFGVSIAENVWIKPSATMFTDGLARQFQSVARYVEELNGGKNNAKMEQIFGDNLGGCNSPHHQRPYDNVSTYGYMTCRFKLLIYFIKVDTKEDKKLEVEEEEV